MNMAIYYQKKYILIYFEVCLFFTNIKRASSEECDCTKKLDCEAGFYASKSGCVPCPPGYFCTASTYQACPAGTFNPKPSSTTQHSCKKCTAGTYSGEGSHTCLACPAGFSCAENATITKCLHATYSLVMDTDCHECPYNHICTNPSLPPKECGVGSVVINNTCVACTAGTYAVNNTCITCANGTFSEPSSYKCSPCPAGYRCTKEGREACTVGFYSPSDVTVCHACPKGHYCPYISINHPLSCPLGSYTTQLNSSVCQNCPAGHYCPLPFDEPLACGLGEYNDQPSNFNCKRCDAGYYSNRTGSDHCEACPEGHYCPHPSKPPIKCTHNQYQPLKGQVLCLTALLGEVVVDATKQPLNCRNKPGSYSNGTACVACAKGNYCPSNIQLPCPPGMFTDIPGQTACQLCPAGYICVNASNSPVICEQGTYSLQGSIICQSCNVGEYSMGATEKCELCPAGHRCLNRGSPQSCQAGLHSSAGISTCHQCPKNSYSDVGAESCVACPLGHTCIDPSQKPTPCPIGTYYTQTDGQLHCNWCPAGMFCTNPLQSPQLCALGSFSTGGNSSCQQCPAGMSCADPAKPPQTCSHGTFSMQGNAVCRRCPAGMFCNSTHVIGKCAPGSYSLPRDAHCMGCPVGHMCPTTTLPPILCRGGEYTSQNQTSCSPCPAGYYCPTPFMDKLVCGAGFYSLGGSPRCKECPAGYKCPQINRRPITCKEGEFSTPGSINCTKCPAGYTCLSRSTNSSSICPHGTYSKEGEMNCNACPDGFACPSPLGYSSTCNYGQFSRDGVCVKCPPGWECRSKDGSLNNQCPFGTYALGGNTKCFNCPAGKECPSTSNAPSDCKPGSFSTGLQMKCTLCAAGSYCTNVITGDMKPCAVGTYSSPGQPSCTRCPSGFACPTIYQPIKIPCSKGSYSTGAQSECTVCEAGSFCANTTEAGVPCPSASYSLGGASQCTACLKGFFCPDKNQPPRICPPGSYSDDASEECKKCDDGYICDESSVSARPPHGICPVGYFCLDNVRRACPAGKYGVREGATTELEGCKACPEGYFCPVASGYPTAALQCPPGHACPLGTPMAFATPCPAGMWSNKLGNTKTTQCFDCRPGFYCVQGDPTGDSLCPAGHYCPFKTTSATQYKCPEGSFNQEQGADSRASCKTCPAGSYCPQASEAPIKCGQGTYQPFESQGSEDSCRDCIAGMACPSLALTFPLVTCDAGHFCPPGSILPNEIYNQCPDGTYTDWHNATSEADCRACPVGFACQSGTGGQNKQPQPCSQGHWCKQGTRHPKQFPCPAGSWSNRTNLQGEQGCEVCPKGWYCLEGASAPTDRCPTGHYCPQGTQRASQYPCTEGTYSDRRGNERWEVCVACPPGHYCPRGSSKPQPCPKGTFRTLNAAKLPGECSACLAGYKCENVATIVPEACPTGFYSPPRSKVCITCEKGHYCMEQATSYTKMSVQFICPAGMHCSQGLSHQPFPAAHPCTKGHYCLQGDEDAEPRACPSGTYNKFTNSKHVRDCQQCPPGFYCHPEGQQEPTAECPPGYFCPAGTGRSRENPCPVGYYRNSSAALSSMDCSACVAGSYCDEKGLEQPKQCPRGSFCPTGSTIPAPCPSGYYGNSTGLRRSKDCTACEAGFYCAGVGKIEPTGLCDAGFYCRGASVTSAPSGGITGGLCPKGGFCARGAKKPSPCPIGKYNSDEGAKSPADCLDCKSGFYCAGTFTEGPTGPCDPGHYCDGKATSPIQHKTLAGHYSEKQASFPRPCPRGFFQSSDTMSTCDLCSKGSYCNTTGLDVPSVCLVGHYCPDGTKDPLPCPPGTYNKEPSMSQEDDCLPCDAGMYCEGTGNHNATGPCSEGYYCLSGSPLPNPGNYSDGKFYNMTYGGSCPSGHFCLKGTERPTQHPCKQGTYNPNYAATNESFCLPCREGSYCDTRGLAQPSGNCSARYYCNVGSTIPNPLDNVQGNICPVGSYCPSGSSKPTPCPAGKYSNDTGFAECEHCPASFYCDDGRSLRKCPIGYFCPPATSFLTKKPCPPGTYDQNGNLGSESDCSPCPAGKFCAGYAITSFPLANVSGDCSPGHYCLSGVDSKTPSAGVTKGVGGLCPPGYFCGGGTGDYRVSPCAPGTYSTREGLSKQSECDFCQLGEFCLGGGNTTSGKCDGGFYCKRGASVANNTADDSVSGRCPIAHQCPPGTSDPQPCLTGTYMPHTGAALCYDCPKGFYCPANQSDYSAYPCPAGHFCPNATKRADEHPCPKGTFRTNERGEVITDCQPCTEGHFCNRTALTTVAGKCEKGFFCLHGSKTPTPYSDYGIVTFGSCICPSNSTGDICPRGNICPPGSPFPQPCPGGFYCSAKGLYNYTGPCNPGHFCSQGSSTPSPIGQSHGDICPSGYYCPRQTKNPIPCPPGRFSNATGNKKVDDCKLCDGGSFCAGYGNKQPSGKCLRKYYCPPGQNSSTALPCTRGHYCPAGTADPFVCEAGSWNPHEGQSQCQPCVQGYFCEKQSSLSPLVDYTKFPCPRGFFCPNGTRYAMQYRCLPGTYGSKGLLTNSDDCEKCPPGKFCLGSSSTWSGNCSAGYHCSGGAKSAVPTPDAGEVCPEGRYCPAGASAPQLCPTGTFNNGTGLRSLAECTNCTCGMFCSKPGLTSPSGKCASRYFCTSGAHDEQGTGGASGECSAGHYCPSGTCKPFPCKDGTYMNGTFAKYCMVCPPGKYCVGDHITPQPCPPGFYCQQRTGFDWKPCPRGTFSNDYGLEDSKSCVDCTGGMYCPNLNATQPEGYCDAGYFCKTKSPHKTPTASTLDYGTCPMGSYCPTNTSAPLPCPAGRYGTRQGLRSVDECKLCDPGYFCVGGQTETSGRCWQRFYCKEGAIVPNPPTQTESGGPCPLGHFCPNGTSLPKGCPDGTYQDRTGQLECKPCCKGFHCPQNSTSCEYECPKGHFCPANTKKPTDYACLAGTYNNETGATSSRDCKPCEPGQYCPRTGLDAPYGECAAGWYCSRGAWTDKPVDLGVLTDKCYCTNATTGGICQPGEICPRGSSKPTKCPAGKYCAGSELSNYTGLCAAGFYCTEGAYTLQPTDNITGNICPRGSFCMPGSPAPTKCPPGTFSDTLGNKLASDCKPCTAGKYCSGYALHKPSANCSQGFYCPPGQNTSAPAAYRCTPGHYCPEGSPQQLVCPSGSFQSSFEQSICNECLEGHFCNALLLNDTHCTYGVQTPSPCPKGYFCPPASTTGTQNPCPQGTFGNVTGLQRVEDCTDCPPGKYCQGRGKSSWTDDCSGGYLCLGKSTVSNPDDGVTGVVCRKGYYCPSGTTYMHACPPGTYNPSEGRKSALECRKCDQGRFCHTYNMTTPSGNCSDGFFCLQNSSTPTPRDGRTGDVCPAGFYCKHGLKIACEAGSYMNRTQATRCFDCPPGCFCVNAIHPQPCPPGYYCERKTGLNIKPCPTGSFGNSVGLSKESECSPCTAGYYCDQLNATNVSGPCEAGFFCRSGSDTATPSGGHKYDAGVCPRGSFCPAGNASAPVECPRGTFNPREHGRSVGDCQPCTERHYCNASGLSEVTGVCDAGFYCREAAEVRNPATTNAGFGPCPVGFYCPRGTANPIACSPGTYNNLTQRHNCVVCPAGFYCTGGDKYIECPKGHYCPKNTTREKACPQGTFRNTTRGSSRQDCEACLPGMYCKGEGREEPNGKCKGGYYCTLASWSPTPTVNLTFNESCHSLNIGGKCRKGFYCPSGTDRPISCDKGHYCHADGLSNVSGACAPGHFCWGGSPEERPMGKKHYGGECVPGSYCPGKSVQPVPCDIGTYAPAVKNTNETACLKCLGGKYCDMPGLAYPVGNCSAGYYCPLGSVLSTQKPCEPGFFCPEGSEKQHKCPSGSYQSDTVSRTCLPCPAGSYCQSTADGGATESKVCPKKYYCPNNTASYIGFPCKKGFFSNKTSLTSHDECTPCIAGFYCDQDALESPTGKCHAGFFCSSGASTPSPISLQEGGGGCREGYYCEAGEQETPCPMGTYGNRTQMKSELECLKCEGGKYCNDTALSTPSGPCCPGYFCTGRSIESAPENKSYGDICPVGHYCPVESEKPTPCPSGSFNNRTKATKPNHCELCPGGSYCTGIKNTRPSGECEEGFYCTQGAFTKTPSGLNNTGGVCPPGSYCPQGSIYPKPCPPGQYCGEKQLGKPSGNCTAGYFCDWNSTVAAPTVCSPGHYCPVGTSQQIECTPGTFNAFTKMTKQQDCQQCPQGFYCPNKGLTNASLRCSPGYHCGGGAVSASSQPCPKGSFCPAGISVPCPPGEYQNRTGQASCEVCPVGYSCDPVSQKVSGVIQPQSCLPGHYCLSGTSNIKEYPCPNGTYSAKYGNSKRSECQKCHPGFYCSGEGNTNVTGKCDKGFFCTSGAAIPRPSDGTAGNICPQGKFCVQGSRTGEACPKGSFGASEGVSNSSGCTPCTQGWYCPTTGLLAPPFRCTPGHWCIQGASMPSPDDATGRECPKGYYCPLGVPIACDPGTYQPLNGMAHKKDCKMCDPGYYCENPASQNVSGKCVPGYYCVGGADRPNPQDETGSVCPAGAFCVAGSKWYQPCPNGTYTNNTGSKKCFDCPAGYSCISGSKVPTPCDQGYYCPAETGYSMVACPEGKFGARSGLCDVSECSNCTGGQYCATPGLLKPSERCDPGYWCYSGVNTRSPTAGYTGTGGECFKGHYCPRNTTFPFPCPRGTFADVKRLAVCKACPKGYYCNGSTVIPHDCPRGHFCPPGTQFPFQHKCPPGTYRNETGATSTHDCHLCLPGRFCQGDGLEEPSGLCDRGYFCKRGASSPKPGYLGTAGSNMTSCYQPYDCVCPTVNLTRGNICPSGHYCPLGSSYPKKCSPGMFCARAGLEFPSGNCTAGYYCSAGSERPDQHACPVGYFCPPGSAVPKACGAGRFSDSTHLTSVLECQNCTAGFYCAGANLTKPDGPCNAGYYCPGGQSSPTPPAFECPTGGFCEKQFTAPTPCYNGTYQNATGQAECVECPIGYYCDHDSRVTPTPCPTGHFCPPGSAYKFNHPCPKGTFAPHQGNGRIVQCEACSEGRFCASRGLTTPTDRCAAGYYCYRSSEQSHPVKHVPAPLNWTFPFYNHLCPQGYFCPSGSAVPEKCPAGYFSDEVGLKRANQCRPCPAGRYCIGDDVDTLVNPPSCSAGFVCVLASTSARPTGVDRTRGYPCSLGHFCTKGTLQEERCTPGTYQSQPQQDSCIACTDGNMCPYYNMTAAAVCAKGSYCIAGYAYPCPAGTFSDKKGLKSPLNCTQCPAGQFCSGGKALPDGDCEAGFVCGGGSKTSVPNDALNKPCPMASYCRKGAKTHTLCPPGTFRNTTGGKSVDDCYQCTPGHFCESDGLHAPQGQCDAGWYCPQGQKKAQPDDLWCRAGHFCPRGSASQRECETGTYQNATRQASCDDCPPGYFCESAVARLRKCPPRYYCKARTKIPTLCPNGTYSYLNESGLQKAEDCRPCIAGHFCIMGLIREKCAAGYLCQSGSPSPTPAHTLIGANLKAGPCPPGYFCPYGAIFPVACPRGTFKADYGGYGNMSDCWPCPAGKQCFGGNSTVVPCPVGKYCEEGRPPKDCPLNYYQGATGSQKLQDCIPCPAGYHCNVEGMSDFRTSPCPLGHYCLRGQHPSPCLAGSRRVTPGAKNATECTPCPERFFCPYKSLYGEACTAGYYCRWGAKVEKKCIKGFYCPEMTGDPLPCPGGYYCDNGTATPIICEFPFYCPPLTSHPLICDLGYKAVAISGNRSSHDDACMPCPAGFYGDKVTRLTCTKCPEGYYCPKGTQDPYRYACPKGFYCPEASADGIPCQPGMYGNQTKATKSSDCLPCPQNTFNHLKGMKACRPCGSSSRSSLGQIKCTCLGDHRSFQVSDGACVCNTGYVYYDVINVREEEGNSDKSCQPLVASRCPSGSTRVSSTLECVDPGLLPSDYCTPACGPAGGSLNVTEGRCSCEHYTVLKQVCDASCLLHVPIVILQRNPTGVLNVVVRDGQSKQPLQAIEVKNEYGINDFDYVQRRAEFVDFTDSGCFGVLPTSLTDVINFFPTNTYSVLLRSRRSMDNILMDDERRIRSPIVCVSVGQAVVFRVHVDHTNRSLSHYPRYAKNHLFNTNPGFDYGQFRQLHLLIRTTNISVQIFANVFAEPGTYVFQDNMQPMYETIVYVPTMGSFCTDRMDASAPLMLTKFGVGMLPVLNEAPDWGAIWAVIVVMFVFTLLLLILVILWHPRKMGIYPISLLRPKYKSMGAPLPVLAIPGVDDHHSPHVDYQINTGSPLLENFNVRTLYDKLEDQSLHISSQLQRHQSDVRGFYDRICQQTEGLKNMLNNMDVQNIAPSQSDHVEHEEVQKKAARHVDTETRQAELEQALTALLQRYNAPRKGMVMNLATEEGGLSATPLSYQQQMWKGGAKSVPIDFNSEQLRDQDPSPLPWREGEVGAPLLNVAKGKGVSFTTGNVGLIQTIAAERMQMEDELRGEENEAIEDFNNKTTEEHLEMLEKMSSKLTQQLSVVVSPEEMHAIIDRHNGNLEEMENNLNSARDKQRDKLLETLKNRRMKKTNELKWKHEQMAMENKVKLADVETNFGLSLPEYQLALENAYLEESRLLAGEQNKQEEQDGRQYAEQMQQRLQTQLNKWVSTKGEFANEAQDLLNEGMELEEKMLSEAEQKRNSQRKAFEDRLQKKREEKMKLLQQKHQDEKANKNGEEIGLLDKQYANEKKNLEAKLEIENVEFEKQLNKNINAELKRAIRKAHNDLLNKFATDNELNENEAQSLMDELRKINGQVMDNLEKEKQRNNALLQNRLAERKAKKIKELENNRIAESRAVIDELSASPTLNVPNVIAGQSEEQKALIREQERSLEELKERHQEEEEKLEDKMLREQKEAQAKALLEFEEYREKTIREMKNKQNAEITSRGTLSSDETQRLLVTHEQQLDALLDNMSTERDKQNQQMREKLQAKKRLKAEALARKQENQLSTELLEQKKELVEAERNAIKEAERQAIILAIQENYSQAIEPLIKSVAEARHTRESGQLENMFAEEKKVRLNEILQNMEEQHVLKKEHLLNNHQTQFKQLKGEDPEELEELRSQLLNKQQLEVKGLETKQSEERSRSENEAARDWQMRHAQAKLDLKEQQYKEFADYLSEFLPSGDERSSIKKAQEAAIELQEMKRKLEEQKKANEEKIKKELQEFEAKEKERMKKEMRRLEEELENEAAKERAQHEEALHALSERREVLLREKKKQAKDEVQRLMKDGASKDEQEALLKKHSEGMAKLANKMDEERVRMRGQLEERLNRKRKERRTFRVDLVEGEGELKKQEFLQQLNTEQEKLTQEVANELEQVLETPRDIPRDQSPPIQEEKLPTSFRMAAPLSEQAITELLLQSPLYEKLCFIKQAVTSKTQKPKPEKETIEEKESGAIEPVDLNDLSARDFVVYKFACFVRDLLVVHCSHPPTHILIAQSLPSNNQLPENPYKSAFYYDAGNRILYMRRQKLENVGGFVLALVHTLSHVHTGDMRSGDGCPKFQKEFHRALSVVCSDLFQSRYRKATKKKAGETIDPLFSDAGKTMDQLFGDCHRTMERENAVNHLLDLKLLRNKRNESELFDEKNVYKRLGNYRRFTINNKLHSLLGEVGEKIQHTKLQGSHIEIDQRINDLNLKEGEKSLVSREARANIRNLATSRTSVHVPKGERGRPDGADALHCVLSLQTKQLHNKIDSIDSHLVSLARQTVQLSEQIHTLEGETMRNLEALRNHTPGTKEYARLSEVLELSTSKLHAARAKFTLASVTRDERMARLNEFKEQLEERIKMLEEKTEPNVLN